MSQLNAFQRALLLYECSVYGIHIKPSTAAHPQAGMRWFGNWEFTEGDIIRYYYFCTLMYQFMVDALNAIEQCSWRSRRRRASSIWLVEEVSSSTKILRTVWLVSARFASLRFRNDPKSLSEKVVAADKRRKEARSENLKSVGIRTARTDYTKFDAVSVQATRNKWPREEVFVDCGKNYEFN